jgi:hypothetical protein
MYAKIQIHELDLIMNTNSLKKCYSCSDEESRGTFFQNQEERFFQKIKIV